MIRTEHIYQIGEIVNETLKVIEHCRKKDKNNKSVKMYKVKSLPYPDAPIYMVSEGQLKRGRGCAYTQGKRIFEGNSLYSIKSIRPYLVDIEEAKTIAPNNNRVYINLRCPYCKKTKKVKPNNYMHRGFTCNICSKGTSYPELFMIAYLEVKGIEYEYQKVFNDLANRRFDFYTRKFGVIEMNGAFHYRETTLKTLERTIESDKEKKNYCKNKEINIVEIDSQESSFNYIKENVADSILPSITSNEEKEIIYYINNNKRNPTKEILYYYNEGFTIEKISKRFNLSRDVIKSVLTKLNIDIRNTQSYLKKKVKCINTGEEFESLEKAKKWCGLSCKSRISLCAKGEAGSAGKHPTTGEKLTWEYVD